MREDFRSIFEASPLAILIADDEGRYVDANPEACRLFGMPKGELLGRRVYDFVAPSQVRPTEAKWNDFRGEKRQSGEFPLQRPDGGGRFLRYRAVADFLPGLHVSFLEDITEQKSAREDERRALETLGAERELRDRFVATLSHDLRSPMTAAGISAEAILKVTRDEEVRRFALRILRSLERANQMIENLLDANRISAGEPLLIRPAPCDPNEVIREAVSDLITIHGERFVLEEAPGAIVRCDRAALRRIVENLAANAVKYGDTDAPVRIRLEASGDELRVSVHNRGNPIPPQHLSDIFRPYHRAGAEGGRTLGWGLGLTLVRGMAEAHGGRVGVESSREAGTTFTVTLPG